MFQDKEKEERIKLMMMNKRSSNQLDHGGLCIACCHWGGISLLCIACCHWGGIATIATNHTATIAANNTATKSSCSEVHFDNRVVGRQCRGATKLTSTP